MIMISDYLSRHRLLSYSLFLFALNLLCILTVWRNLGSHYTPVSDAWVSLYLTEHGGINLPRLVERISNLNIRSRTFRQIPFLIDGALRTENFLMLKVQLIAFYAAIGTLAFLIARHFLKNNALACTLFAFLFLLYPNDGTMFFFGAFGVNMGFMVSLASIALFQHAVSKTSHAAFAVSALLIGMSFLMYPGYIPFVGSVIFLTLLANWRKALKNWYMPVVYLLVTSLTLIPLFREIRTGANRVGHVADFDPGSVFEGYAFALKTLFFDNWLDLVRIHLDTLTIDALVALVVGGLMYLVSTRQGARLLSRKEPLIALTPDAPITSRQLALIAAAGLLIAAAGYLPFAISSLRFELHRPLLFARSGAIIIVVTALVFALGRVRYTRPHMQSILIAATALAVFFGLQAKGSPAREYAAASLQERLFIADLISAVPDPAPETQIFIVFKEPVYGWASMLINRPEFPIRYVYEDRSIHVIATTDWRFGRFGAISDGTVSMQGDALDRQNAITLEYRFTEGFSSLDRITIEPHRLNRFQSEAAEATLPGWTPPAGNIDLSPRQLWWRAEGERLERAPGRPAIAAGPNRD